MRVCSTQTLDTDLTISHLKTSKPAKSSISSGKSAKLLKKSFQNLRKVRNSRIYCSLNVIFYHFPQHFGDVLCIFHLNRDTSITFIHARKFPDMQPMQLSKFQKRNEVTSKQSDMCYALLRVDVSRFEIIFEIFFSSKLTLITPQTIEMRHQFSNSI